MKKKYLSLLLLINFHASSCIINYVPGKTSYSKIKNGIIIALVVYNTLEIVWRRLDKLFKPMPSDGSNTNLVQPDFLEMFMDDLGIVTQEKLAEYVHEILEKKYPYLSHKEILKMVNLCVKSNLDVKLKNINSRLEKLEKAR